MYAAPWIAHWIIMVSDGITWYLMVIDGIQWYCMVFNGILVFNSINWYSMVLHGIRDLTDPTDPNERTDPID